MMAELALFISPISVILTICTLVFHRKKGTVGFAAAAFIFNLLGAAFFLYHIVSLVWNEGVDLYEGFGSVAVVVSILFAVLNASALSHGRLRARYEASSGERCGKLPMLRVLADLAVFEALGLIIMQEVAEFSYRIDYQLDYLYGLLAAGVIIAIHLAAALSVCFLIGRKPLKGLQANKI